MILRRNRKLPDFLGELGYFPFICYALIIDEKNSLQKDFETNLLLVKGYPEKQPSAALLFDFKTKEQSHCSPKRP